MKEKWYNPTVEYDSPTFWGIAIFGVMLGIFAIFIPLYLIFKSSLYIMLKFLLAVIFLLIVELYLNGTKNIKRNLKKIWRKIK